MKQLLSSLGDMGKDLGTIERVIKKHPKSLQLLHARAQPSHIIADQAQGEIGVAIGEKCVGLSRQVPGLGRTAHGPRLPGVAHQALLLEAVEVLADGHGRDLQASRQGLGVQRRFGLEQVQDAAARWRVPRCGAARCGVAWLRASTHTRSLVPEQN